MAGQQAQPRGAPRAGAGAHARGLEGKAGPVLTRLDLVWAPVNEQHLFELQKHMRCTMIPFFFFLPFPSISSITA